MIDEYKEKSIEEIVDYLKNNEIGYIECDYEKVDLLLDCIKEKAKEIERLNNIIGCLKQMELYCVDYETEEDIETGKKIYLPFNLEEFIQELDKVEEK